MTVQKHMYVLIISLAIVATYLTSKHWILTGDPFSNQNFSIFRRVTDEFRSDLLKLTNRTPNGNYNNKIIYFLGLFELSTLNGPRLEAESEVRAAKLAVKHVNSKDVLPGYLIKLLINDTKCDPGVGVDRFFHAIYSTKKIIMLLGSGCSNVTESLAHIVVYWNILQVSFGSTSPNLSDRNEFPLFFRTVPPDSSYNPARAAFLKHFGWETVAAFCESENTFLLPLNNLVTILENANITCTATVTFSQDNYREQLLLLKTLDTRIIVGSFSESLAPKIFCEVYNLKMFGSDYVWLLIEPHNLWWGDYANCNSNIIKQVVEGSILISDYSILLGNETSLSGLTETTFAKELNASVMSKHAKHVYDAVWSMALTLRSVHGLFDDAILDDFNYNRKDLSEDFVYSMSALDFMGVSGPIRYHGADRVGNVVFKQIQNGELKTIAIYYTPENFLNFNCSKCHKVLWHGGQVPIAQRVFKTRLVTIPQPAFYIIFTVSVSGISFCVIFLYLNVHFRRIKSFKLSSPKLNNAAVLGCILVYTAIILLGFDRRVVDNTTHFSKLCTMKVYLLSAGFSLAFGSMFAKTYRVHRIFITGSASLVKDKILKDKQLLALILLLLLIDAVILTFWVYVDPLHRQLKNLTIEISPLDRGVVYQQQVEICACNNTRGWFVAIYGYKGFLLIIGVYMAWETRNVKIQALNESQYIGICVYSAVSSAIVVLLSNFLSNNPIISYLATTSSILISTTITLFLLFLPKLRVALGKTNEHEDPVMQSMGLKFECNTRRMIYEDRNELCLRMEIQNKVYRNEIEVLDREISRLEDILFSGRPRYEIAIIEPHCQVNEENGCGLRVDNTVAENLMNNSKNFKSENVLYGTFPSRLYSEPSLLEIIQNLKNDKPSSNPEISTCSSPKIDNIFRTKSSISVISNEYNKNVFVSDITK